MSQARIIIYLEGGLIQEIMSCDQILEIIIHDLDVEGGTCDEKMTQIDGKPVYLTKWDVEPEPESLTLFNKLNTAWKDSNDNVDSKDTMEEAATFTCEACGKEADKLCCCCGVCPECCNCGVSLISSGYEWTCTLCQTENNTIEVVQEVTCQGCGKTYHVDECIHAL